jgi:hypothetical protein
VSFIGKTPKKDAYTVHLKRLTKSIPPKPS